MRDRHGQQGSRPYLFITLKEFAKILDEAYDHHDSRSRQTHEEGDFEQSHQR
jgi:hypothetical protein